MRSIALKSTLALLVLAATAAIGAQSPPAAAPANDAAAIEALVAGETAAWNRHDAKAFAARYAADGSFTNIIGQQMYGREAFERQHAQIFATIYKDSSVQLLIGKLRFIRPDVAVVDVDANLSGYATLPPGVAASPDGVLRCKLQMVVVKEKNTWWITAFHNVVVTPLPPGA